jgi:hypothetical protein
MDWVRKEIVPENRGYYGPGNNYVIRCRIFGTLIKTSHGNAIAQAIKKPARRAKTHLTDLTVFVVFCKCYVAVKVRTNVIFNRD